MSSAIWTPDKLGCWSVEKARMFGMPCIGAEYTSKTGDHYRILDDAQCMVCGKPASHVHHEPNKGIGGHATLELAGNVLRPALFALCTKCHDQRHFAHKGDRLLFRWKWVKDTIERDWVNGSFLNSDYDPHDNRLFLFGYYEIYEGEKLVKIVQADWHRTDFWGY